MQLILQPCGAGGKPGDRASYCCLNSTAAVLQHCSSTAATKATKPTDLAAQGSNSKTVRTHPVAKSCQMDGMGPLLVLHWALCLCGQQPMCLPADEA
jgi:hypothetical protein